MGVHALAHSSLSAGDAHGCTTSHSIRSPAILRCVASLAHVNCLFLDILNACVARFLLLRRAHSGQAFCDCHLDDKSEVFYLRIRPVATAALRLSISRNQLLPAATYCHWFDISASNHGHRPVAVVTTVASYCVRSSMRDHLSGKAIALFLSLPI